MGVCFVIGAGECNGLDFEKTENDFVICADGGLRYAEKFGVAPDLIVGDFDSYGSVPSACSVIALPREKDETDTHYAVKIALERGYNQFRLYGMLGGRIDHTLANIQLLMYITEKGGSAVLVGDDYDITIVKNNRLKLNGLKGKYVSVFSYSPQSNGVTIKGLKYEVSDISFAYDNPLGVSNEFTDEEAFVEVKDGIVLIATEK